MKRYNSNAALENFDIIKLWFSKKMRPYNNNATLEGFDVIKLRIFKR